MFCLDVAEEAASRVTYASVARSAVAAPDVVISGVAAPDVAVPGVAAPVIALPAIADPGATYPGPACWSTAEEILPCAVRRDNVGMPIRGYIDEPQV